MQIVDVDDRDREKEATRHFLSHLFFRMDLLKAMGMDSLTWVIMEAQKPHLVPGLLGDIDILAGNLQSKDMRDFLHALERVREQFPGMNELAQQDMAAKIVCEDSGLCWPPESSRVVGIEVKCGYFDTQDGPQSHKSSTKKVQKLRQRIDLLLEMGLDAVALLDIIGNEAASGANAFLDAGWQAQQSARAFQPLIEARLSDETPAAQFCWAVGAVFDRDESFSGGGGLLTVRRGLPNPLLQEGDAVARANRRTLLASIASMLGAVPVPRYCPVFFIDCMECGRLHLLEDPACRWMPRHRGQTGPAAAK